MSSHTKEQEEAVVRVLSCGPHDYYEILKIEKTANDNEIKKSYRKLAVRLHPDKNSHPRAAEAFKHINKAWEVLSDPSKRKIFDQTGVDPDSKYAGVPEPGMGSMRTGPFARTTAFSNFDNAFEQDIFNLFFGGSAFPSGGTTYSFGNNGGFTFTSFGDDAFFGGPSMRQRQQRHRRTHQPEQQESYLSVIKQFLPIILFFLITLLSMFFSDAESEYSFRRSADYSIKRTTPKYNIPFYVQKGFLEKKKWNKRQLDKFDLKVEYAYVKDKREKCSRQQMIKNNMIEDAYGWFYTDQTRLNAAENMPMPDCDALKHINLL